MSAKTKFNIFNSLFHLFSFFADKTNGWSIFVKPKLLFGSLIVGVGVSANAVENSLDSGSKAIVPLSYENFCYLPPLPPEPPEDHVYEYIEQTPQFPGGEQAMWTFIKENVHYPASVTEIQGRVTCRFIIGKDGTISNIGVVRGLHTLLDKEAVRVIESMPKWIPGELNGKPVRVYYTIPIVFKLQ